METKLTFTLEDAMYYSKRFRDMSNELNFEEIDDMFDEIAEDYTTEDNVRDLYSEGEGAYSDKDFLAIKIFVDLYTGYKKVSSLLCDACEMVRKYTVI